MSQPPDTAQVSQRERGTRYVSRVLLNDLLLPPSSDTAHNSVAEPSPSIAQPSECMALLIKVKY